LSLRPYHVSALLVAGAAILVYFLLLAQGGLGAYFSGDDMMNIAFLHGYGRVSFPVLAAEAVSPFTPEYRPVGGVYYRTLYALFGLHPLPFRIAFFALLIGNLGLAGLWIWRLTGSRTTALMSTAVFSFHAALAELYYNDGTVYDVLCLFFVLILLSVYTRIRRRGEFPNAGGILLLAALYAAALGSKEMAITLPGVLLLCELFFDSRPRDLWRRARPIVALTCMTLLAMIFKVLVPQMTVNSPYWPRHDPVFIAHGYLHYYRQLFFAPDLTGLQLMAVLVVAAAGALALRSRIMLFGLLFANLTLFPVCVIPPRGGFVWYMPLLGCALYMGGAISRLAQWTIAAIAARARSERVRRLAPLSIQALLFGCLIVASYLVQAPHAANMGASFEPQQRNLRVLWSVVKAAAPSLPSGGRILLESDPFPELIWDPLFLIRLGYGDPTVWVDRVSRLGDDYHAGDVSLYAMKLRYNGRGYDVETRPAPAGPPVPVSMEAETVRRGHALGLHLPPAFAGCPIDVAYRMLEDELMRAGVWYSWASLDASGAGFARVDRDAERGPVVIDRVRACRGDWRPARGSFVVVP